MTIEELINELECYDKELEIHVYSITNDKDATISHIGRGNDENGIFETFVSICTEDTEGIPHIKDDDLDKYHTIKINPNTYNPVTEPNMEVVQAICNAFVKGDTFAPYTHQYKCYHCATRYIDIESNTFRDWHYNNTKANKLIHDCDMKKAFEYLINAGYNMFTCMEETGYVEIVCSGKPYYEYKGIFYSKIDKYVHHID